MEDRQVLSLINALEKISSSIDSLTEKNQKELNNINSNLNKIFNEIEDIKTELHNKK